MLNMLQSFHFSFSPGSIKAGQRGHTTAPLPSRATHQQLLLGSYGTALVRSRAAAPETQRSWYVAYQELSTWYLLNMPAMGKLCHPLAALPEEIMLYYDLHWLPSHGETLLEGKLFAASSSLENNCSLLSTAFEHAGRTGPYSIETCTGNPMQSRALREYKEGYSSLLRSHGYASTSAKHLDQSNYVEFRLAASKRSLKIQTSITRLGNSN